MRTDEEIADRPRKMLGIQEVLKTVPFSKRTLLRMEAQGRFPKGVYLAVNSKAWYEDEIVEWQRGLSRETPATLR